MRIDRAFFVICIFAAACGDGSSNHAGGTPPVPLSAVFRLYPGPKFAVGFSPTSVAAGDLNEDGRIDVVTANLNSDEVSVLIGQGDGSFVNERRFFAGRSPHSVAIADLDGDGHSDLVVTTIAVGEVSVLLGRGDATFSDPQIFPIGAAVPTYQPGQDGAENIGCGFLKDGRLLTTDVGNQVTGEGSGQLIVWFPPFGLSNNRYCKLDTTIATAGGLAVDDQERIYVASARGQSVYRYTGPFPTGPDAAGGCGGRDATGAPLADHVNRETFINDPGHTVTPTSVILSGHGTFFVASVLTGVIAEYDANGAFLRVILQPPPGEDLADLPYSTGTPFGLGIDSTGTLYYADLGLVASNGDIGPGDGTGTVRRIRFQNGNPLPPETIDSGLSFPDGIGILEE